MSKPIEDKLDKIPVVRHLASFLKSLKLPGLEGLTFYDLLELYITGIFKGTLTERASAISFSFFSAIFPFILFIIILIPYIPVEGFRIEFEQFLQSFLPPQTSDFFFKNIFNNIGVNQQGGLISTVFILSIFLMANGVNAIFVGFESSYHRQLTRSVVRQYLLSLGVGLLLGFLLIFTVAIYGYFEIFIIKPFFEELSGVSYADTNASLFWVVFGKYLFFVMMVYLAIAILYYFGTKEGKESRFFSVGALFSTLLIMISSFLFGLYIENFSSYNELYGSIGALLILLFYLWLNSNIVLLGFELNMSLIRLRKSF
ncbi:membrane protein [Flavobacteriaceae bacterium MAR_2010_188]|nr:membrane protein [Flavobacteriaceae bacterium MAR_2010_188]